MRNLKIYTRKSQRMISYQVQLLFPSQFGAPVFRKRAMLYSDRKSKKFCFLGVFSVNFLFSIFKVSKLPRDHGSSLIYLPLTSNEQFFDYCVLPSPAATTQDQVWNEMRDGSNFPNFLSRLSKGGEETCRLRHLVTCL